MEFEYVRIIISFHVEFADGVTPLTRWTELREKWDVSAERESRSGAAAGSVHRAGDENSR